MLIKELTLPKFKKIAPPKFYNFLKTQKVIKKYLANLKEANKETTAEFWEQRFNHYPQYNFDSAFIWAGTKEGHQYWRVLNSFWYETLEKENNNETE